MSNRPWIIKHLDLAEGVPALDAGDGTDGIFAVFWWNDLPLGHHVFPDHRLPLPAGVVRDIALDTVTPAVADRLFERGFRAVLPEHAPPPSLPPDHLALKPMENAFQRALHRMDEMERSADAQTMSVIICTRDRADDLRTCLESLLKLETLPEEIIVVDNAPTTDATRTLVHEFGSAPIPVQYVLEERAGLSVARNAGIRAATCELVAFTDDDVIVHPRWLSRLRAGFASSDIMAVSGLVLPSELETEAQQKFHWNHQAFSWSYRAQTFDSGYLARTRWRGTPVWQIGAGANMAFRRQIFREMGGFDERLGAGASGCSEDSELWYRILTNGYRIRYEPASVVFHTHRRTLDGLRRQLHDYMQGHVVALLAQFERERHPGDLLRATYWLPRYYGGWVVRRMIGRHDGPSLLAEQIRGFLNGFGYYLRHRHDPAIPALNPSSMGENE